jgi:tetratricopeptide (TPR) repeat protein
LNKKPVAQQAWLMSMSIGTKGFQEGRMVDAVNAFTQATKLQPGRVESWVNLGSALLETNRFEESAVALNRAITLNRKLMVPHMLLGDALRQLGEMHLALGSYRQAVMMQRSPHALNKLACALRVRRQYEEARALYLEALHLDPKFTLAAVNLTGLHIEMREFEEANRQLAALLSRTLPRREREEVLGSQRALAEYFRLNDALTILSSEQNIEPLQTALAQTPELALQADEPALANLQRYIQSALQLAGTTAEVTGSPPEEWPLIEAMFMIPLVHSAAEYRAIRAQLANGAMAAGELLESCNMQDAVVAARASRGTLANPVTAELHLRHWHLLACRELEGFLPGHFKYTQNWSTTSPTLKRVQPAMASGTFRRFITQMYNTLPPGLLRAAVVFMAVTDLHPFADGNGRVAITWLNRELEWAGLMPALSSRELGLKGELGDALKTVRTNGGDLSPLVAVIVRAQHHALEFCAELAQLEH